jgi:hypothetical protein
MLFESLERVVPGLLEGTTARPTSETATLICQLAQRRAAKVGSSATAPCFGRACMLDTALMPKCIFFFFI